MNVQMRTVALVIFALVSTFPAYSRENHFSGKDKDEAKGPTNEKVVWTGTISDDPSSHNSNHDHLLKFKKRDDGQEYSVIDSPSLVAAHHEKNRVLLVEIEGEVTPRFLFWGNNLVVKNFKVIDEIGPILTHKVAPSSPQSERHPQSFNR